MSVKKDLSARTHSVLTIHMSYSMEHKPGVRVIHLKLTSLWRWLQSPNLKSWSLIEPVGITAQSADDHTVKKEMSHSVTAGHVTLNRSSTRTCDRVNVFEEDAASAESIISEVTRTKRR